MHFQLATLKTSNEACEQIVMVNSSNDASRMPLYAKCWENAITSYFAKTAHN